MVERKIVEIEEFAAKRPLRPGAPPPDKTGNRRNFLVVDDDARLVRAVCRRLVQIGFTARGADGIESAITAIAERAPEYILLDVHLGEVDGREVNGVDRIDDLRAAGFRGPLIVLSGDGTFAMAHRAAIAGADGYLLKGAEDMIPQLLCCLERRTAGGAPEPMPRAAAAYVATRGLTEWEMSLAMELARDGANEKEIAARTGRGVTAVRKGFETIRKKMGASTQHDLARMLGVLSCFGRRM